MKQVVDADRLSEIALQASLDRAADEKRHTGRTVPISEVIRDAATFRDFLRYPYYDSSHVDYTIVLPVRPQKVKQFPF